MLQEPHHGRTLSKHVTAPFPSRYKAELDVTPELDAEKASFFKSQIGVLKWCVELGRINIITEVYVLSSHLVLPCEGHLEAVFHLFAHNSRVCFIRHVQNIDMTTFKECDWKHFCGDAK